MSNIRSEYQAHKNLEANKTDKRLNNLDSLMNERKPLEIKQDSQNTYADINNPQSWGLV